MMAYDSVAYVLLSHFLPVCQEVYLYVWTYIIGYSIAYFTARDKHDGHNKGTKTPISGVTFNYWPTLNTRALHNTLYLLIT